MYRQVAFDGADRDFHRILWRDYVTYEIRKLPMTHVTYGEPEHFMRVIKFTDPFPTQWKWFSMTSGLNVYSAALIHWTKLACFKTEIQIINKSCLPLLVTRLLEDLQEPEKACEINDKTNDIKSKSWDSRGILWRITLCVQVEVNMFQTIRNELYSVLFRSNWPHCPSSRISQSHYLVVLEGGSRVEWGSSRRCHGHTQTGKLIWVRCHNSSYPGWCYQLTTCTMKRPCMSSVMLPKDHMVLVFVWSLSKMTSSHNNNGRN